MRHPLPYASVIFPPAEPSREDSLARFLVLRVCKPERAEGNEALGTGGIKIKGRGVRRGDEARLTPRPQNN